MRCGSLDNRQRLETTHSEPRFCALPTEGEAKVNFHRKSAPSLSEPHLKLPETRMTSLPTGARRVVDGDTVEITPVVDGFTEVRLIAVDTPETSHPTNRVRLL
jgi:endonuclease YncB( thermonuclease family)